MSATRFTRDDALTLAAILTEVARAEIIPRFRRLGAGAIRSKSGPLDLVTEADELAEVAIAERLARAFPDAVLVGEEATARDPDLLARLRDAPLAIVVDPIDGTANFAAGLPLFGSMAAIVADGEVVACAIHDPLGGDTAIAARGQGASLVFPDGHTEPLRVASPAPFTAMTGKAAPRHVRAEWRERMAGRLLGAMAHWDFRCAAHEYRTIAGGHAHFSIYNQLMPWDHLPGVLLHREAGGYAARLDGSPYRPTDTAGGLLCAPDRESWEVVHAALLR
jgi:fructose-1,6-bisphosphatase/inositol monophosphatase family enzyme